MFWVEKTELAKHGRETMGARMVGWTDPGGICNCAAGRTDGRTDGWAVQAFAFAWLGGRVGGRLGGWTDSGGI